MFSWITNKKVQEREVLVEINIYTTLQMIRRKEQKRKREL